MSSKKENHPVEAEITENAYDLTDIKISAKHKDHDIEIYLENSAYSTPEYIHVRKGNRIIVIDYIICVSVLSCGNSEFQSCFYYEYLVRTNCKTNAKFKQMLKLIDKKYGNNEYSPYSKLLKSIISKIKDIEVSEIYKKNPDIKLKTFKQIKKHPTGIADEDVC